MSLDATEFTTAPRGTGCAECLQSGRRSLIPRAACSFGSFPASAHWGSAWCVVDCSNTDSSSRKYCKGIVVKEVIESGSKGAGRPPAPQHVTLLLRTNDDNLLKRNTASWESIKSPSLWIRFRPLLPALRDRDKNNSILLNASSKIGIPEVSCCDRRRQSIRRPDLRCG